MIANKANKQKAAIEAHVTNPRKQENKKTSSFSKQLENAKNNTNNFRNKRYQKQFPVIQL